jgi:hypothetical protein
MSAFAELFFNIEFPVAVDLDPDLLTGYVL